MGVDSPSLYKDTWAVSEQFCMCVHWGCSTTALGWPLLQWCHTLQFFWRRQIRCHEYLVFQLWWWWNLEMHAQFGSHYRLVWCSPYNCDWEASLAGERCHWHPTGFPHIHPWDLEPLQSLTFLHHRWAIWCYRSNWMPYAHQWRKQNCHVLQWS